jgi:TRAP-type C4-dicarboxylate transport system permease small subunit
MFLAIPHGIRYGVHVGIDVLVILFPADLRRALFRVTSGLGALLMVLVLYAAIFVTADKWQDLMPTIEFTAAVFYIAVLISAAHSLLHLLLLAWGGEDAWKGAET